MKKRKVKDVVHPDDVFVSIEYLQGLATGESLYCTIEDIMNNVENIPEDVRDYILQLWDSLTFDDLTEYDGDLDFLADCFSFYKDFLEYVSSHKCYIAGYYYTRDGAKPFCDIDFFVFC